jgi:hypothetical protein
MSDPVRPGIEHEPVGSGLTVLRFWSVNGLNDEALRLVSEGKAQPTMFALSEVERRLTIQSLSVWVEAVTPARQAWRLSGAKLHMRVRLQLDSDAIRMIQISPAQSLDVVWEQAMIDLPDGIAIPDTRPGAEGHAGIRHLEKGTSAQRRLARFLLSEAARAGLLPPELPREWAEPTDSTGHDPPQ